MKKIIIEVDGTYWHNYPNYRKLDLLRNIEIKKSGWDIIRFWEFEVNEDIVKRRLQKAKLS